MVQGLTQGGRIHQTLHPANGVPTIARPLQQLFDQVAFPQPVQHVETFQPRPIQQEAQLHDGGSGNAGLDPGVRGCGKELPRQLENFVPVTKNPAADLDGLELLPLLNALPFQLRNIFEQLLGRLVIRDGLADPGLPIGGHVKLPRFSLLALSQVKGLVEFSLQAAAVGLATATRTQRQAATHDPAVRQKLHEAGTLLTFKGRELGFVHDASLIYYIHIRFTGNCQLENECELSLCQKNEDLS